MCPLERKQVEDVAREAGIQEDDIQAIVDMEMRMKMVQNMLEGKDIMVIDFIIRPNNFP